MVKEKILISLMDLKIYSEVEAMGMLYLEDENLTDYQKKSIAKIISKNYAHQGRMEEAEKFYDNYFFEK